MQVDWHKLIFEQSSQERLNRQAFQRFKNETLAEEAITYAIDTLSQNNWQILHAYDGRASPPTFLHVAIGHAFEDFHRRRFGRRRPPAWIQKLGSLWELAFTLACLERLPAEDIVNRLLAFAASTGTTELSADDARKMVRQVRGKVTDCEARSGELTYEPHDPVLIEQESGSTSPAELLAEHEMAILLEVLAELLGVALADQQMELTERMQTRRNRLKTVLQLADDDRILLKLIYQDGCSVSEAARRLEQPDHTIRRKLRALLEHLRSSLQAAGLAASDVLDMLRERTD